MEKQIHVNSYVRKDGTEVREHYRNIDSSDAFNIDTDIESSQVLQGGVSKNVEESNTIDTINNPENIIPSILSPVTNAEQGVSPIMSEIIRTIDNNDTQSVEPLKPKLDLQIKQLDKQVVHMKQNIDRSVTKLINTTNQTEYSKLHDFLQSDYKTYQDALYLVNHIKGYAVNGDYQSIADELVKATNNNSNHLNIDFNLMNDIKNMKNNIKNKFSVGLNYMNNLKDKQIGRLNKAALDKGIPIYAKYKHEPDAAAMWKIASHGFQNKKNNDYISRNGALYNGINSLGDEYTQYKPKITEKVKSQFGKEDVPGIVFHENSSPANAIATSQELSDFVNKNISSLQAGKTISGSMSFTNGNLNHAFGKVDVLSAKLNNGYVDVTILDTYDFNKDDKDLKVQMGYSAQKAGLLKPYYTIVKCRYKI